MTTRRIALLGIGLAVLAACAAGAARLAMVRMGRQPDCGFLVSSGQRIEGDSLAFEGRPIDLALHPSGEFFAVLNKNSVFLATPAGLREGSRVGLGAGAGFRGLVWSPDGQRLFASTDKGFLCEFLYKNEMLAIMAKLVVEPVPSHGNPVPGGMAITRDGKRLYVVAANRNAVVEIDLDRRERTREFRVENLPFEAKLCDDDRTLIVSNWGGRIVRPDDKF
jgi:hypothetical protein